MEPVISPILQDAIERRRRGMRDDGGELDELHKAQALLHNVRWWINHGKVETAEKAIADYWRGWSERYCARREHAPKEKGDE